MRYTTGKLEENTFGKTYTKLQVYLQNLNEKRD